MNESGKIQAVQAKSSIKIGLPAFITAFSILLILIVVSGILTRVIPAGRYEREIVEGRQMVVEGSYTLTPDIEYPVWRWFTAPLEVIWGDNWLMVAVLTLFMVFIGGSFTCWKRESYGSPSGPSCSSFREKEISSPRCDNFRNDVSCLGYWCL